MAGLVLGGRRSPSVVGATSRPRGLWRTRNRTVKSVIEWWLALGLVIALSPLFLVIALRIRRDGGPALFVQSRVGLHGRPIQVFKFRSMHVANCNPDAKFSVQSDDPGVTAFGARLRRSGLDELPQLLNVLNGSMSLIGPRPHVPAMLVLGRDYADLVPLYTDRLAARPGMTGLAQVRGWCGPVDTHEHAAARIACDREYIERWSPLLDLQILVATGRMILCQARQKTRR